MWTYQHAGFRVHQLPALKDNYIYLIEADNGELFAAVDPAEALPVAHACSRFERPLTHIFNTHHHWDHTGGNLELKGQFGCTIVGAADDAERIPGIDEGVGEGNPPQLAEPLDGLDIRVLSVHGHTMGHIAYLVGDALFCGDTLFGGGCGRVFEGTMGEMWAALAKLAKLPADTKVYCAHEYTLANLRFARDIDPDNEALRQRISEDTQTRMEQQPTIPSTIGLELATNPFLRVLDAGFRTDYAAKHGIAAEPVAVFTHIRESKDRW